LPPTSPALVASPTPSPPGANVPEIVSMLGCRRPLLLVYPHDHIKLGPFMPYEYPADWRHILIVAANGHPNVPLVG
jgi:hypothetical protein